MIDQYQTSTIKNLTATTNVYNPELVTKLIITGQYSNYIQATPIVKGSCNFFIIYSTLLLIFI